MTTTRITHIGGPAALIEVGEWRLLTDPTFDPPGRRYSFGWAPLPGAGMVLTTAAGARRLGGNARGLQPWRPPSWRPRPGRPFTSPPPPPPRPTAESPYRRRGDRLRPRLGGPGARTLWITGDTVLYDGVRQVADRLQVDTALLHLGGVHFPVTGPVRYSMDAREAVELCRLVRPRTVIPVHYEGWTHFRQGRGAIKQQFEHAQADIGRRLQWLPIGASIGIAG